MRFIIQQVSHASVTMPKHQITHTIHKGVLVYMGIHKNDQDDYQNKIDNFIEKIQKVKMLTGESGKIDKSLEQNQGEILLISNFTIYGRNKKGNNIDYTHSAPYHQAQKIYDYCTGVFKKQKIGLKTGMFGEKMHITSTVLGPINHIRDI